MAETGHDDHLDAPHAAWSLDPRARTAMLLQAAREALGAGDAAGAVSLAEELLDHDPDDVDALLVVADAAPRYGHAEVGMLAAEQARRRGASPGAVEAAALLAACEIDRALEAADAVLASEPDNARALAVRGQALEVLGADAEALVALRRASELRPDAYPLPIAVAPDSWDALLQQALSGLAPELRDVLRALPIELRESPALAELRGVVPAASPAIDVLLVHGAQGDALLLFRRNLVRGAANEDDVAERIRAALEVEARVLIDEAEAAT